MICGFEIVVSVLRAAVGVVTYAAVDLVRGCQTEQDHKALGKSIEELVKSPLDIQWFRSIMETNINQTTF